MITSNDCWLKDKCKNQECSDSCLLLQRLDTLYNNAFIPLEQRKDIKLYLDSEKKDLQAFNEMQAYTDNVQANIEGGNGLYIYSKTTGNGKTSWALKIIRAYLNKTVFKSNSDCKVLFINVPRYLLALKSNISERNEYISHINENILNCDLVVWDDIGSKAATEFEHENLLSIIDTRLSNGKCNIYTSNLTPQELRNFVGERLYSRIILTSKPISLVSGDKRNINWR